MSTTPDWRGAAVSTDETPTQEAASLKRLLLLKAQSRELMGELLRPHRRLMGWIALVVLLENAARLSVPYLVKEGIDRGIPPIVDGQGSRTLLTIVGVLLMAVLVQAVTRQVFLSLSGKIGQQMLLTLRRRVFSHFHRLSPAFHEEYTSGRVISRQTSDMEAIDELLEGGFDGLVTAALTLVGTSILLLVLDFKLGLVALCCAPALWLLTRWFRVESAKAYRRTRETVAVVIVHFVETINGMRAVQAFRREGRNQAIFDAVNDDYRQANVRAFWLVGTFMPGIKLIGNVTMAVVLIYGAKLAFDGEVTVGVLAAFLLYLRQFFEPMQEISQF
ncbi:MAG: ABC transporter ATP-binding protein, partial [Nocardioidaceae bacterium]|nr:ABC transporter ATP-binding protein [Nocardioidaceae bacterium]